MFKVGLHKHLGSYDVRGNSTMLVKFVSIWSEVTTGRGEGGLRGRGVTCYVRLWIKHLCPEKFEDIFRILHCGLTWWNLSTSPSLCWSRLLHYLGISDHPLSPCFTRSTSSSSWWTRPSTSSSWWSDHPSGVWQGWSGVLTRGWGSLAPGLGRLLPHLPLLLFRK